MGLDDPGPIPISKDIGLYPGNGIHFGDFGGFKLGISFCGFPLNFVVVSPHYLGFNDSNRIIFVQEV